MSTREAATPKTIKIADAHAHAGERVTLQGWLYNLRKSGKDRVSRDPRWERHDAVCCREGECARAGVRSS